jgi:hypothetical protein
MIYQLQSLSTDEIPQDDAVIINLLKQKASRVS